MLSNSTFTVVDNKAGKTITLRDDDTGELITVTCPEAEEYYKLFKSKRGEFTLDVLKPLIHSESKRQAILALLIQMDLVVEDQF